MLILISTSVLVVEAFAILNRGGGPLLSHMFLTGAVFVVLVAVWRRARSKNTPQPNVRQPNFRLSVPLKAYAIFVALVALSMVWSQTKNFGLPEFLLFINGGFLLFMLVGARWEEKHLKWFSIGLIGLAVADTLAGYFIYTHEAFPRFVGTFIDLKQQYLATGNDYADFILLVLPLAVWQFLRRHERATTTMVSGLAVAILFSGFLLSFSRAAWFSLLAIIIIAGVWIFLHRKSIGGGQLVGFKIAAIRILSAIIITALLVAGLQYVRSPKFQTISLADKLLFRADEGGESASSRLEYWQAALKIIRDHPVLGSGAQSFEYLFSKYQKTFGINISHPHNILLKIGVENGVLALAAFVAFLVLAAIGILRFLSQNPRHFILPFVLGALGAFGHNLLDFNFTVANFTLFAAFVGIAQGVANRTVRQSLHVVIAKPRHSGVEAICLLLSFILVLLCLHEAVYNRYFQQGRAALADKKYSEAVLLLERSKGMFFERDLGRYLIRAYERQYEATRDRAILNREAEFLKAEAQKPSIAPAVFAQLGEIFEREGDMERAEDMHAKALRMDSMNRLKYYYLFLNVRKQRGRTPDATIEEKAKTLVLEYTDRLAHNANLTILTDNPQYASKLLEFFGMKREREELDRIWFNELLKFTVKYGATPSF